MAPPYVVLITRPDSC